ncbi:MAG: hypothetical protein WBA45_00135 [Microthrixaceae bacterium]
MAVLLVVTGVLGACVPAPEAFQLDGQSLAGATLTHEHGDTFTATSGSGSWRISSGTGNNGVNTRMVFWSTESAATVNGGSCIRFDPNSVWPTQEGVALRIATSGGQTRAVTVTKNVFGYATNIYNVHSWRGSELTLLASVDASRSLAGMGAVNLCGRIDGNTVRFKIWRSSNPEPSWEDRSKVNTVKAHSLEARSGHFGIYAGHLPPNTAIKMTHFPVVDAPRGSPPSTVPPTTAPPTTAPPSTVPPSNVPPATVPPSTVPPATDPADPADAAPSMTDPVSDLPD